MPHERKFNGKLYTFTDVASGAHAKHLFYELKTKYTSVRTIKSKTGRKSFWVRGKGRNPRY